MGLDRAHEPERPHLAEVVRVHHGAGWQLLRAPPGHALHEREVRPEQRISVSDRPARNVALPQVRPLVTGALLLALLATSRV